VSMKIGKGPPGKSRRGKTLALGARWGKMQYVPLKSKAYTGAEAADQSKKNGTRKKN